MSESDIPEVYRRTIGPLYAYVSRRCGGERTLAEDVVQETWLRAVDAWRKQGVPDYVQSVTEEPEDGGYLLEGSPTGDDDPETQLYRKAVQIVAESQKASTSYIQRQLRVGYNSAARLIERMEKDGLVGAPDHVGRREVLIDTDGHPI